MTAPLVVRDGDGEREERFPGARVDGPDHLLGVEHLVECVEQGRGPLLSADHAVHVVEILDAARRSAAEGVAIDVRSSFPIP
jgi:predicted dehydrogenase